MCTEEARFEIDAEKSAHTPLKFGPPDKFGQGHAQRHLTCPLHRAAALDRDSVMARSCTM